MKIPYLVASVMAAAVVASPLAYSAPGSGTQVTHFQTRSDDVYGYTQNGSVFYYFRGQAYDDMNGVPQGSVYAEMFDYSSYFDSYIFCSGPDYAKAVSVNQGNGNSSFNATLDPSAPGCNSPFGYNYNVSAPLKVNLAGQFDGNYRNSQNGTGKQTYGGASYKYNFQNDDFSETFTGTNGFYSGTFTGDAYTQHNINRQQVK